MDITEKQLEALGSTANELLYGGAAGGGKSFLLRAFAVLFAFYCPRINIFLFRRTLPELKKNHILGARNIILMAKEILGEIRFNQTENIIYAPNGSTISLNHCQHELDVYNFQGVEFHILLIDELTHFTEAMYRYLRSRVRLGSYKPPAKFQARLPFIATASNPSGVGHHWVKQFFVDNGAGTIKKIDGFIRQFIKALITDNPFIEEGYIERLKGLGNEYLIRAMLDGDWDAIENGAISPFWDADIHFIKPFRIPASWEISRSFDWGSAKPFSVGWWAVSDGSPIVNQNQEQITYPRHSAFRISELYGWSGKANEGLRWTTDRIGRGIQEHEFALRGGMLNNHFIQAGPADSSIWDGAPSGLSIANRLADLGIHFTKANKKPGSRVQGLSEFQSRLDNAKTKEYPGVYIFNTCHQFKRTVPPLSCDKNNPDDVDSAQEDHIYDEVRYFLMDCGQKFGFQRII